MPLDDSASIALLMHKEFKIKKCVTRNYKKTSLGTVSFISHARTLNTKP